MELQSGDIVKRDIKVIKVKDGSATKVEINGREYSLVSDQFNGNRNKLETKE